MCFLIHMHYNYLVADFHEHPPGRFTTNLLYVNKLIILISSPIILENTFKSHWSSKVMNQLNGEITVHPTEENCYSHINYQFKECAHEAPTYQPIFYRIRSDSVHTCYYSFRFKSSIKILQWGSIFFPIFLVFLIMYKNFKRMTELNQAYKVTFSQIICSVFLDASQQNWK